MCARCVGGISQAAVMTVDRSGTRTSVGQLLAAEPDWCASISAANEFLQSLKFHNNGDSYESLFLVESSCKSFHLKIL